MLVAATTNQRDRFKNILDRTLRIPRPMASPSPRLNPQIPILLVDYHPYVLPRTPLLQYRLFSPTTPPLFGVSVLIGGAVVVALVLNMANVLAFTRCDKDQKRKWATGAAAGVLSSGYGGFGGRIASAVVGRFFG